MSNEATAAALERLYRERFRAFVRAMTAQLGDAETARDVVQDAFASALRASSAYRHDGPLEGWVWRIVVNKALDERRRRAARVANDRVPETHSYEANGSEEKRVLRVRLAALPERQRLAVFLHYYADLDYATIAEALDIAPGTVAATLHAARTSLRERLKEDTG